jgi:hypothetical protein
VDTYSHALTLIAQYGTFTTGWEGLTTDSGKVFIHERRRNEFVFIQYNQSLAKSTHRAAGSAPKKSVDRAARGVVLWIRDQPVSR